MSEVLGKCEHCLQPVLSTHEWEKPPLVKPGPEVLYHTHCLRYGMLTPEELGWQPSDPSPELRDPKLAEIPSLEEGPEIILRSARLTKEVFRKGEDGGTGC